MFYGITLKAFRQLVIYVLHVIKIVFELNIYFFTKLTIEIPEIWNIIKVNNKDTRATSLSVSYVNVQHFPHCSSISLVDLEQVNAGQEEWSQRGS